MKHSAIAIAVAPAIAPAAAPSGRDAHGLGAVESLRRRLAGTTARDHAVLDYLEGELCEARAAVVALEAYLASVDGALADEAPSAERLDALARATDPAERVERLKAVLQGVRRRLWQVAARM